MELRNHPLMSRQGLPNWPPTWVWIGGKRNPAKGEIGVLVDAKLADDRLPRIFIWMENDGGTYIGCLLFEDRSFCRHVLKLLQSHTRRTIDYIGGIDVRYTL
jgi:hypothetical protein